MPTPAQLNALKQLADASVQAARAVAFPDSFADLSLAQAILESGWLARTSGKNNVFGIIADHFNDLGATTVSTHEQTAAGLMPRVRQFQNYASLEECFADHARIFTTGLLAEKCGTWLSGSREVNDLVSAISYPTDPPHYATDANYAHSLCSILKMPAVQAALAEAKQLVRPPTGPYS